MSTGGFPVTRFSVVRHMRADDPDVRARALDAFATAYWMPVSRYIRFKWRFDAEHAADLTQEFFARTLENDSLARFDPARARFRTYVRLLVDGFVSNARKAGQPAEARRRVRRGAARGDAGRRTGALHEPPVIDDHDEAFYREWVRALFEGAVDDVRAEVQARGRDVQFEVFRRYDLADMRDEAQPSYAEVATALGLTVATVTNHLAAMRRLLRARVLDRLREATGSDAEYEAEAKRLLGSRPMTALDDGAVARLRAAADVPDLGDRYAVRGADRTWWVERGLRRLRPGTVPRGGGEGRRRLLRRARRARPAHPRGPYPRRPRASRDRAGARHRR